MFKWLVLTYLGEGLPLRRHGMQRRNPFAQGIERSLGAVGKMEFAEDAADMVADGAFTERQPFSNLTIHQALRQQLQDFQFPFGQGIGRGGEC